MDLTNIAWQLVEYGPLNVPVPAARTPATITFNDDGSVNGSGGCNRFNGSYEASTEQIGFGQLAATLQACADDAVNQQERAVFEALAGDRRYEVGDGTLRIVYGDANALVFASDAGSSATATAALGGVVDGTVTYRQRIALPPDAAMTVQLLDTSRADAPAITIAEHTIAPAGQVPIAFSLPYDPAQIEPRNTYTVRAEIRGDNALQWVSTTAYPVITNGNGTTVEIVLEQITD